ncbi:YfjI family protein [Bacillus cytotoxicus]
MNGKAVETLRSILGDEAVSSAAGFSFSEETGDTLMVAEPQQGNTSSGDWGEVTPFDEYEVPSFPVEVFPKWLKDYVEDVAEHTQTPADMACMMALSVLSVALAKKYTIQPSRGWYEPLNTYIITFMPPSNRKSSVFKAFTFPLLEHESEENERKRVAIEQSKHERDVLERIIEDLKKDLVKAEQTQSEEDAAAIRGELNARIEEMERVESVRPVRYFTDDVTPEQLITLMLNNSGRMAVLSAEGGFFDLIKGRYSNNTNIDVYLKGFSQDQITVDRRGRTEKVDNPHLTVGLFAQLDVIKHLPEYFYNRGLMARFLYAVPKSFIGYRKIETEDIREDVQQRYSKQIKSLLTLQCKNVTLSLNEEAKLLFNGYRMQMEHRMREGDDLSYGHFQSWAGKLPGQIARIMALIHIAHYANQESIPTEISEEIVKGALYISQYFVEHMMATFGLLSTGGMEEDAKYLWKVILRQSKKTIAYRDIQLLVKKRFKKAEHLKRTLNELSERNYIREYTEGRKNFIAINPILVNL